LPYPETGSEVHRNLQLMQFLGTPIDGNHLELDVYEEDLLRLGSLLGEQGAPAEGYVVVHAGSKWQSRRWPADRFVSAANALSSEGFSIVLTGGTSERSLVEEVSSRLEMRHANLCGKTDLGSLAAAIKRARLLVTNDTGVSHVAAAMQTPSVVVVLGSEPQRWTPLNAHLHEVVLAPLDCRPCAHEQCPADRHCGETVSVDVVMSAAHRVLQRTGPVGHPRPARISMKTPMPRSRRLETPHASPEDPHLARAW
jgi:ADP-heptose:LPS heptosyltransferase